MNRPDEEENGDPFYIAECLMDVFCGLLGMMRPVIEQHQDGGAEHGYRGGFEMQWPRKDESDHDNRGYRRATA